MLTCPEIRLISAPGMKKGETRRGPRSFSRSAVSAMDAQPADARADHHAGAQPAFLVLGRPAGILTACCAAAMP
jgi:hypothetical protein